MPLSWNDRHPDPSRAAAQADRAHLGLVQEARERAALLHRLGWPREYALRRVLANHEWETADCGGPVLSERELTAAVDAVYRST